MNFLVPAAFLGALLAVPIILLYMLRLRRREVMISSTFLWRQVMQDREANTPWQRLRRNLLLLLQLIILALLVLALARPYISVPAVSRGQTALLIDASASMNATDIDGRSRFDEARRRAGEIVDTLGSDQAMTVIRVADAPDVLAPYTTDRTQLRDAIASAGPSLAAANWDAAFNLAVAGRTNEQDFTIIVISDGGLGETVGLPGIEGEVRYIPIGTAADNVAITALAARAQPGSPPQLFAQITNYGPVDMPVVFSLRIDGELTTPENVIVPAGSSLPIVSTRALPAEFSTIEASVTLSVNAEAPDYLEVDNRAYTTSPGLGDLRVLLVTAGNIYIEQVFALNPAVQAVRATPETGIPATRYDLYVFDGWLPDSLPEGDLLIINPPESTPLFTLAGESQAVNNPVVEAADPRVAFVDFSSVALLRFRLLDNVGWADPLIRAEGGPLLLAGEIDGRQVAILPFELRESTLPLDIAWVILISNLIAWYAPQDVIVNDTALAVSEPVVMRPPLEADRVRITLPGGQTRDLPIDRETLIFTETTAPGLYSIEVIDGDEVIRSETFAVNLFSELESQIAPVPQGSLRVGQTVIPPPQEDERGQREYWPLLALAVLAMLLIEWYAYHRRQGMTRPMPSLLRPVARR
jgi:hypothetical protein